MEQYSSSIRDGLYKVSLRMQKNRFGRAIFGILEDTGIRIAVSRFFNWKNARFFYKNGSPGMAQAKIYFDSHAEDINRVTKILSDDESVDTYKKMIMFRQTFDYDILPPNNSYRAQYFGNDFFKYEENEVFVDCGAYNGDTLRRFKRIIKNKGIKKYKCVCFEPDKDNIACINNSVCTRCYMAGVWSESRFLVFESGQSDTSKIVDDSMENLDESREGLVTIPVVALDDISECQNATFIKMDIEGAEQQAIIGAKNIIKNNKPKLAICIYHSDEDMIKIPLLIHDLVPEYRLYIRHHSNGTPETVLYATL